MSIAFLNNTIFLLSLGWAIVNSLWQAGFLWVVFKTFNRSSKKSPALFKYTLSLFFFFLSFAWFIYTLAQNYFYLQINTLNVFDFLGLKKSVLLRQINIALPFLSVIYLAVVFKMLGKFCVGYCKVARLKKSSLVKAPVDIRLFTARLAIHMNLKKLVVVWLSDKVDVPAVIGFVKPVILLPAAIVNQLSIQQMEAVLLHEMAHIKRNDFLVNLLQSLIECLLFFNPFSIALSKAARQQRENCCDDWIVNHQYNLHDYAGALLVLEKNRYQQLALAMAATNNKKQLLVRIKRLFAAVPQTDFNVFQILLSEIIFKIRVIF